MRYLYGDSTPFPLAYNFLETLVAATDTCVALLHLDTDAVEERRDSRRRRARTEDELARLELLRDRLEQDLAAALASDAHDAVSTVAARLANELERAYVSARQAIATRTEEPLAAGDADSDAVLRLLERLLVSHELPHSRWALQWRTACGDEAPRALARCATTSGLDAQLAIHVPVDHVLAEPVRLRQLVSRTCDLALDGVRVRDLFVTRLASGDGGGAMRLQETPGTDARGFEVEIPAERGGAPAARCVRQGVRVLIAPGGVQQLAAAWERVAAALGSLRAHRRALVAVTLDGVPVARLERPRELAEALIAGVAPLVRELCARSRVPGEITLKRERGDGQRDELFIPQAELLAKLRGLSADDRALFAAYGLEGASDIITAQVRRLELPLRATTHGDV